ncbi:hypothetical protein CBER1_03893 [Cercospora berteroae]|uniref:Uncharacterized protein n=1 Tax=Cercospora berteroae TaxID=357750 RepID=A0A2S6C9V7_9PEZI|nr:hypothetical protein CBER1_03893 [Cercospora berteroae]
MLGDKYNIPQFHDLCVAYILREFSPKGVHHIRNKLRLITKLIAGMPPNCSLLSLMAEEVAYAIYMGNIDWFELMCFDGTDGFWTTFLAWYTVMDQYEEWSRKHFEGLEILPRYEGSHWEEFMVGEFHPIFDLIQATPSQ